MNAPSVFGSRPGLELEYVGPLTDADIRELSTAVKGGGLQPLENLTSVAKLRTSHHNLARLLAEGSTMEVAAIITGYTVDRIAALKLVPAFQELIAFYGMQKSDVEVDVNSRLKQLGIDSLEVLHEKLTDDPDSFKNEELMKLVALTMDRSGHGPTTTQKNLNVNAVGTIAELRMALAGRALGKGVTLRTDMGEVHDAALRGPHAEEEGLEGPGPVVREEDSGEGPA